MRNSICISSNYIYAFALISAFNFATFAVFLINTSYIFINKKSFTFCKFAHKKITTRYVLSADNFALMRLSNDLIV